MGFSIPRDLQRLVSFVRFFYVQRVKGFKPPGKPLLDDETADWVARRLQKTKFFLEFGSGGSTLLANQLGVHSLTVESDRFYAAAVRTALPNPNKARIITPDMGITGEWGMPVFSKSKKGPRYVQAPFVEVGTDFPDFIFVDGRYRVACALESARLASQARQRATVLVDDYEERPHYHVLEQFLGKPERIGRAAMFDVGRSALQEEIAHPYMRDPR